MQATTTDALPTPIPVNHHQLTRYVASPRRSVLRVLQQFHAEGLIDDQLGRITILDPQQLRKR